MYTDEQKQDALQNFDIIRFKMMAKQTDGDKGKDEPKYARAYQILVRMGLRPQIKAKYRGR